MIQKRLAILLIGCCCLLTCQTTQQLGFNQARELPDDPSEAGVGSAPNVPFEIDDLARRTVTETRRIDARLARMAVSSVATGDGVPLLRLDTLLLGASDWIASSLQHCGLDVRRVEELILVKSPQSGANPRNLRAALREALPQIYAAMDRAHDNLAGRPTIGHKATYGALDHAIGQQINALTPHLAAGLARRAEERVWVDFTQGPIDPTAQPLDLAIEGNGLFALEVQDDNGCHTLYTRNGSFHCRQDGTLVLQASAEAVLTPSITVPRDATGFSLSPTGTVLVRTEKASAFTMGRVTLTWFEHPDRLEPIGRGLFTRTPEAGAMIQGPPAEAPFGILRQGCLERSNVDLFACWSQLCRLEDVRQIVLAMMAELDGDGRRPGGLSDVASAGRRAGQSRRPDGVSERSTVWLPLPEPSFDAVEATLVSFFRHRGVDVVVGSDQIALERCETTASALVDYLAFLRKRLGVIGENIASASCMEGVDGAPGPYHRKIVVLNAEGDPQVVEDRSPCRLVWAKASAGGSDEEGDGLQARLAEYPNVDVEIEIADSDAVMREYQVVRGGLEMMGRAAVGALTAELGDPSSTIRCDAALALKEIGPDACSAVPALIQVLSDGDWQLRKAAAGALPRIAPESDLAMEAVVNMWIAALGTTTGNPKPQIQNPKSASSHRYQAAVALGRLGPRAATAVPALVALLDDPTSGAARALGQMGAAAAPAVPALVEGLRHREVYARQHAADALGRIGPAARPAVPALVSALNDDDAEVRWRAAAAVGLIGATDSGCIEAVAELLRDEDAYVRDRVAEVLGRLGRPTADITTALRAASRTDNPRERVWPLFALALLSDRSTAGLHALSSMIRDEHPLGGDSSLVPPRSDIRLTACGALIRLGPVAAPVVPFLITMTRDEDDALAALAVEALGAVGPGAAAAVPTLSIALDRRDPLIRRRAAVALGRIGPPAADAVPALVARLKDSSEQVVLAAVKALGQIGPLAAESAEALRKLEVSPNATIRSAVRAARAELRRMDDRPPTAGSGYDPALADSSDERISDFGFRIAD